MCLSVPRFENFEKCQIFIEKWHIFTEKWHIFTKFELFSFWPNSKFFRQIWRFSKKKIFCQIWCFFVKFELFQKKYFFAKNRCFLAKFEVFFCETEYLSWRTFVWNLSVLWTTEEVTPQYWNYICSGWGYVWHNNSITDKVMKWYWQGCVWHDSTSEITT